MNIKYAIGRLLGVKDSMVNKGWEDTVTFKELKYILEGLDEPTEDCTKEIYSRFYNENRQLKTDLAIANGLVKNLEEIIKRKDNVIQGYSQLIRNYTKET